MSATPPPPAEDLALKGLRKRKVVDTSTAETIGRVEAVHLDPSRSSVVGLIVRGGDGGAVSLDRVQGLGRDAITVGSASDVVADDDHGPRDTDAYGSRVIDEAGHELGKLTDLMMDAQGAIRTVVVDGTPLDRPLMGVGSYAVVVGRARS